MKKHLLSTVIFFFIKGCGNPSASTQEPVAPTFASKQTPVEFSYNLNPISPQTRIFLVAGARDSANFAQAVVDQKKLWLARGYRESEIACYYVAPDPSEVLDAKQFYSLAKELRHCHPNVVSRLLGDIASLDKSSAKDFYFYLTSHGSNPFRDWPLKLPDQESVNKFKRLQNIPSWTNNYMLSMEAGVARDGSIGWSPVDFRIWNFAELRPDAATADLNLFTPRSFAGALQKLRATAQKYIGVSGCYSGGFILPGRNTEENKTLTDVENVTVITASHAKRTSFGCETGAYKTVFDTEFELQLKQRRGEKYSEIDWRSLYKSLSIGVNDQEAARKIKRNKLSFPQFFSN